MNIKVYDWISTAALFCFLLLISKSESLRVRPKILLEQLMKIARGQEEAGLQSNLAKRSGCQGFPCMFTHLGSNAGAASLRKMKMSMLRDCISDPECFTMGKRTKNVGKRNGYGTMLTKPMSMYSYPSLLYLLRQRPTRNEDFYNLEDEEPHVPFHVGDSYENYGSSSEDNRLPYKTLY